MLGFSLLFFVQFFDISGTTNEYTSMIVGPQYSALKPYFNFSDSSDMISARYRQKAKIEKIEESR